MLNRKTVLVLGAGASLSYGFPLGRQLRDQVCQLIEHENHPAWQALAEMGLDVDNMKAFAEHL